MHQITDYIFQDWQANKDTSFKSRMVLVLFRINMLLRSAPKFLSWLSIPYCFFYQVVVEWILGIELPWDTQVGSQLKLQHGHGLVVNHAAIIGRNCILRHTTTIGNKVLVDSSISTSPKIGDNVDIGAHVIIIGSVTVGDNAVIGAGSVVVKDVPEGAVVVGNPARVIRTVNPASSSLSDRYKRVKLPELETVSNDSSV